MGMDGLTAVFGWMLLINVLIYMLQAGFIVFARDWVSGLQARMTGVPRDDWPRLYVDYLSRYKIAIIVFNLAPWLALLIAG